MDKRDKKKQIKMVDETKKTISKMGRLSVGSKVMLHTREAVRLFDGRKRDERIDSNGRKQIISAIVGAKRIASCFGNLSFMAGQNNPYADWFLVLSEELVKKLKEFLSKEIDGYEKTISIEQTRGMVVEVMKNPTPAELGLNFNSPYGHVVTRLVTYYDGLIRRIKTVQMVGLISDDQATAEIKRINKEILTAFMEIVRMEGLLNREQIKTFSRVDFLMQNDLAKQLNQALGTIPKDILLGHKKPDFRGKHVVFTSDEIRKLENVYDVIVSGG